MTPATKVLVAAGVVIVPLVAAAWLPLEFPHLLRQCLLCVWGVGATLAFERALFSHDASEARRALGFVRGRGSALAVALLACLPMWAFLPLFAWTARAAVGLRADWLGLLLGVVLVNGITEEVIHRGFAFGHLRRGRSFAAAATISAAIFAAQHLYIIVTTGVTIGVASVALAALLAYPLAFIFERGGHSIAGPALLHTSSNAPVIIFDLPERVMMSALVPHMGVVLASLYLMFAAGRFLPGAHAGTIGAAASALER